MAKWERVIEDGVEYLVSSNGEKMRILSKEESKNSFNRWEQRVADYLEMRYPKECETVKKRGEWQDTIKYRGEMFENLIDQTYDALLKKNPLPNTDNFIQLVQHKEMLLHQAEEIAFEEVNYKPW